MNVPALRGLHHVKLPVSDLGASTAWYTEILGAKHEPRFDHYDGDGLRYAVILTVPGSVVPLELRWAPAAVAAIAGYDPVSFAVGHGDDLRQWVEHLDRHGVAHSAVIRAAGGDLVVLADPDGTRLRLLTVPDGGVAQTTMDAAAPEPDDPWVTTPIMAHPGAERSS
jgi:catechol 2,3-dioxygenase-like lactoylglutathione lyase family enzyme